jgi:hypothetical protein
MFRENFNQEIRESVGARRRRNSGSEEGQEVKISTTLISPLV